MTKISHYDFFMGETLIDPADVESINIVYRGSHILPQISYFVILITSEFMFDFGPYYEGLAIKRAVEFSEITNKPWDFKNDYLMNEKHGRPIPSVNIASTIKRLNDEHLTRKKLDESSEKTNKTSEVNMASATKKKFFKKAIKGSYERSFLKSYDTSDFTEAEKLLLNALIEILDPDDLSNGPKTERIYEITKSIEATNLFIEFE